MKLLCQHGMGPSCCGRVFMYMLEDHPYPLNLCTVHASSGKFAQRKLRKMSRRELTVWKVMSR